MPIILLAHLLAVVITCIIVDVFEIKRTVYNSQNMYNCHTWTVVWNAIG